MSGQRLETPHGNHVTVHDGSASRVHAVLDDLRAASAALRTIGGNLIGHQTTVATIRWHLPVPADVLSPRTAFSCTENVMSLTFGEHALGARGGRALLLSGTVSATIVAYEGAESVADRAMSDVQRTVAVARLAVALGYGLHRFRCTGDAGGTLTDTLERFPDSARGAVALVETAGAGFGYAAMVKILGAFGNEQATHSGPVTVTEKHRPGTGSVAAATTIGGAAHRIDELHRHGTTASHIQTQRVVDAHGRGRWVVLIPGTQDFAANRPNPADGSGNLQSIAGHPSAMSGAVVAALSAAQRSEGVYGKGESVLLIGHSQGGMVAANLARDSATRHQFNIERVATFGSPVGHQRPGASQLDVVNTRDLVPAASGTKRGTDDAQRVTVTIDDRASMTNSDGKREFSGAHDATNYGADYTDALASAPSDSGIRRFDDAARPYLQGKARTYVYDAHRTMTSGGSQ